MPIGSPSLLNPAGTDIPHIPAMFVGVVRQSFMYMAKGSSVFAPILKATVGEVGVINASHFAKVSSNSCFINLRTLAAFK